MGRYRPPAPKSSPYITRDGHRALQEELKDLWLRRADVTRASQPRQRKGIARRTPNTSTAKRNCARSPAPALPAETPAGTEGGGQPTDPAGTDLFRRLGQLQDDDDRERVYRIVGADEFDTHRGWISMDSPLARALMKKTVDDEILVETPGGARRYLVVGVSYDIF